MKTFYALISIGMLVIHCQAVDVSSAVAVPTNASVLFRALMDANTTVALTNVLLQYHALPLERQNEMLVRVIFKMGSHEKLLIPVSQRPALRWPLAGGP